MPEWLSKLECSHILAPVDYKPFVFEIFGQALSVYVCENCESLCYTNVTNDENTWVLLRRTILLSYFEKRRGKMGKANSKLKGDTLDKLTADTYCEYYSKQQLQHPKSLKCETK